MSIERGPYERRKEKSAGKRADQPSRMSVVHNGRQRETVTIMTACELVGVSRRTIYNWIKTDKVEYVRTAGGSVRICVDTLWRTGKAQPAAMSPGPSQQESAA